MTEDPSLKTLASSRIARGANRIHTIVYNPTALRPDAITYCLSAMEKFSEMPQEELKRIATEIALKGRTGLDTNDPAPKYQLKSLPGNFSGLNLVCLMYVAFKSIAPETDIGFDLSKENAAAKSMRLEKPPH